MECKFGMYQEMECWSPPPKCLKMPHITKAFLQSHCISKWWEMGGSCIIHYTTCNTLNYKLLCILAHVKDVPALWGNQANPWWLILEIKYLRDSEMENFILTFSKGSNDRQDQNKRWENWLLHAGSEFGEDSFVSKVKLEVVISKDQVFFLSKD